MADDAEEATGASIHRKGAEVGWLEDEALDIITVRLPSNERRATRAVRGHGQVHRPFDYHSVRRRAVGYLDAKLGPQVNHVTLRRFNHEPPASRVRNPHLEHDVLVYPSIIKVGDVYCMWYGSYTDKSHDWTAIGFAASEDGVHWHKHPDNPVLRSDTSRPWESNYVTSESVMRLPDGSFRIWYASRKAPPFRNLYFALNTARWSGPKQDQP